MTEKANHNPGWPKWVTSLLSPFVISLIVTALIIILFFPNVTRYKISINAIQKYKPHLIAYDDVNVDGISELITVTNDIPGHFALIVMQYPSGKVNQWNFDGVLINNTNTNDYLIVGDFDNNSTKEIYILSLNNDSILLHCISDINNNVPKFKDVFIARVGPGKGNYDPAIVKAEMDDLNDDGYKELIFGVNSGFSLYPRNIFAYDLHNMKCLSSPYLGFTVNSIIQKDITGDGKNEILMQGHGPDNIKDTTIKYHDRSTWLMVLDRNLNFLFNPKEFKGANMQLWPFVFENQKSRNQAGYYVKSTDINEDLKICLFSKEGEIAKEKSFQGIKSYEISCAFTISEKGKTLLVLQHPDKNELIVLNQNLEIVAKRNINELSYLYSDDFDGDRQNEIVSINSEKSSIEIFRNNLQDPVDIHLPDINPGTPLFSIKKNGKDNSELVVWDHSTVTFLSYQKNPLYILKWLIYISIYLSILLFIWLIRHIQRYQIEQKLQVEKKITELQMKIVKNQLDPHFTLNAVNSIIYAVGNNEPDRAKEHLYHFSNLYRHLLLTSDQYKCTLKDELTFTENYLKMEQLRFRDKYSYEIRVDEDVNTDVEVPKMCIQTAAENAVKHGIFHLREGGMITVKTFMQPNRLVIEVSDNGIGREAANTIATASTRKGIHLTQQYFELYTKITNRKVTSEIIDMKDDSGHVSGTKVVISIQLN